MTKNPLRLFIQISLTIFAAANAWAVSHSEDDLYEPGILSIVETIQSGELDRALVLTNQHLQDFPKSRVGQLLLGDIWQAMVHNPVVLATNENSTPSAVYETAKAARGLKHQILNRWHHRSRDQEVTHQKVPASLIDMGRHKHVMVSDMQAGRLYLYQNREGRPILIRDYYLTVGSAGYGKQYEGDNKTPIGVYSIYQHIDGSELPDLYGEGAYPVNYPNAYDRALERTGYGIWLHGTPSNTYARSPWASEGCFVLSNDDLLDIEQYIDVENRTPVILADSLEWISHAELKERRQQLTHAFQAWKNDWESLNIDAYLSHYEQENYKFGTEKFHRWAMRKEKVNAEKTFIQVDMAIEGMFLYPGEKDMFVVQYTQRYLSNNYASETRKEQYWQRNVNGQWRIVYES